MKNNNFNENNATTGTNNTQNTVNNTISNSKEDTTMNNAHTMTISEFAQEIKTGLEYCFGKDFSVELNETIKNNGTVYHAVSIRKEGQAICPSIYYDGFYAAYCDCKCSVIEAVGKIRDIYENNHDALKVDADGLLSFENAKDKICYRLINAARNEELLSRSPYIEFMDLAITFFIVVSADDGIASIKVDNNIMKMWNISVDQLYELAKVNTPRMFPETVMSLVSMMSALTGMFFEEPGDENGCGMFVATNSSKVDGAAVICYPGVLQSFADKVGGDFFIIPSSVHEVIMLPELPFMDASEIREIIHCVNTEQVRPEELLSDNLYRYCAETGRVSIA